MRSLLQPPLGVQIGPFYRKLGNFWNRRRFRFNRLQLQGTSVCTERL